MPDPARQIIRQAAKGLVKWPITFVGPPGTGKSCATLCVADRVPGSFWTPWEAFWRFMRDVNFGEAVQEVVGQPVDPGLGNFRELTRTVKWTYSRWWWHFHRLPLAIFDDVGLRERANDTQFEALKTALDQREGLPFILSSNLGIDALGEVFDLRVHDRLLAGTVIELKGESLR